VIIDEKKSRNIIASNTKKKKNYINTPIMSWIFWAIRLKKCSSDRIVHVYFFVRIDQS
jgi:hypothetical protein